MMPATLDRRTLIAALASLVAGCTECCRISRLGPVIPDKPPVSDAHVHLFNAADLPVEGFLRYVVLPDHLKGFEILWPAIIHLAGLLKTNAITAEEEIRHLPLPWGIGSGKNGSISAEQFADIAADEIERQTAMLAPGPLMLNGAETDLAASHVALARLLEEAQRVQAGKPASNAPLTAGQTIKLNRRFIARLARDGAAAMPVLPSTPLFVEGATGPASVLDRLWSGIAWMHDLLQPRCSHAETYLATIKDKTRQTRRIVNLLVDYDSWLDDRPLSGSSIEAQLRFWTAYARAAMDRLKVDTFAPFDPLRDVEDQLTHGDAATFFGRLEAWAAGGVQSDVQISGFKLYPPMGFKAAGNSGPPAEDRAGTLIRKRWGNQDPVWPVEQFGDRIEQSLDRFFDLCVQHQLPVLAHAYDSNQASTGSGKLACPAYWLDRVRKTKGPLRIALGHFSIERYSRDLYLRILQHNATSESKIYLDIAFCEAILEGGAPRLLSQIADLCAAADQNCQWFLFGSDWIMLGKEPHVGDYLSNLLQAAEKSSLWSGAAGQVRLENLMHNNLETFLSRPLGR